MTDGYKRYPYYPSPQGRGFHDPYSKYPNWAGGLRELLQQMATIKQWKEQRKQREWQRGIEEERLELQRRRLEQPKEPTIQERRWSLADEKVVGGDWTPEQGKAYKLTGRIPEPRAKYPKTTVENVRKEFGITEPEWMGLSNQQKGGYIQEFRLRTRPSTREILAPEEKQIKATFEKHQNLVKVAMERLKQHKKDLAAKAKISQAESWGVTPPNKLKAQAELANIDKLIDQLGKITVSSMASGRPLMPEYLDAIKKLLKASKEDLRSGKFHQGIISSWAEQLQEFRVGQKKQDAEGNTWEYIGNNQWRKIR